MSIQKKIKVNPISSLDSADILVTYQPINLIPLENGPFFIRIQNNSDEDVAISFDGTTDHEFITSSDIFELNALSGAWPMTQIPCWPKLLTVYARGSTAGTGRIYLSSYYMSQ